MTIKHHLGKLGAKNPRWNGGISEYPDHWLLKKKRIEVLRRTKGKCQVCGEHAKIIHHIDENKASHDVKNLIPLCNECHWAIHTKEKGDSNRKIYYSKFYQKYGIHIREIAAKIGISETSVRYYLKDKGTAPLLIKRKPINSDIRNKIQQIIAEFHR